MRITTVQWDTRDFAEAWERAAAARSDLLVLPEFPFAPWLPDARQFDADAWDDAVAAHDETLMVLSELQARVVVGSRPVTVGTRRYNESFVFSDGGFVGPAHRKTFVPNELGYWEACWYDRGPTIFEPVDTAIGRIGIMLCTEMWFFEHARELGRRGVDFLIVPRATPATSVAKWVSGGTAAATVSGTFCLSANQQGKYRAADMGGGSWIIEPEEGDVLGLTNTDDPILSLEVDPGAATKAKTTYPRYVDDSVVDG